jgi:chromosome segregation ATPase
MALNAKLASEKQAMELKQMISSLEDKTTRLQNEAAHEKHEANRKEASIGLCLLQQLMVCVDQELKKAEGFHAEELNEQICMLQQLQTKLEGELALLQQAMKDDNGLRAALDQHVSVYSELEMKMSELIVRLGEGRLQFEQATNAELQKTISKHEATEKAMGEKMTTLEAMCGQTEAKLANLTTNWNQLRSDNQKLTESLAKSQAHLHALQTAAKDAEDLRRGTILHNMLKRMQSLGMWKVWRDWQHHVGIQKDFSLQTTIRDIETRAAALRQEADCAKAREGEALATIQSLENRCKTEKRKNEKVRAEMQQGHDTIENLKTQLKNSEVVRVVRMRSFG